MKERGSQRNYLLKTEKKKKNKEVVVTFSREIVKRLGKVKAF